MKTTPRIRLLLALFLSLSLWLPTGCAQAAERAVIVVLDGLRATEGFDDPYLRFIPHMGRELAPCGALARACDNMGLTVTIPGHAAIASGRYQVLADDGTQRSIFPLLWEYCREATGRPDRDAVIVATKRKIRILSYSTWPGYGPADSARAIAPTDGDAATVDQFILDMGVDRPVIAMLNLGAIDQAAHSGVWSSYTQAIRTADSLVALLWSRIEQDPVYAGRTALIVTGDHGRHSSGYGDWTEHGDGCPGCRRIPLLALGPDFSAGIVSWTHCQQSDLCKTLGAVLALPVPLAGGRVLSELLQNPAGLNDHGPHGLLHIQIEGRRVRFTTGGSGSPVDLSVFDVGGRRIGAGRCDPCGTWSWESPAAGVFFCRARGASAESTGRLLLLP